MKFIIEIDVVPPPEGYGPPEWAVWEKGCLTLLIATCGTKFFTTMWDDDEPFPVASPRIICRPLPKPPEYNEPDIRKDWGYECEFSNDPSAKKWITGVLIGREVDGDYIMDDFSNWKYARIRVDA